MRALHDEVYGWVSANPVFVVVALLIVAAVLFRLASRGRWLVIIAMVAGWAVMAAVASWWLL
jgi:hypothetical protein